MQYFQRSSTFFNACASQENGSPYCYRPVISSSLHVTATEKKPHTHLSTYTTAAYHQISTPSLCQPHVHLPKYMDQTITITHDIAHIFVLNTYCGLNKCYMYWYYILNSILFLWLEKSEIEKCHNEEHLIPRYYVTEVQDRTKTHTIT